MHARLRRGGENLVRRETDQASDKSLQALASGYVPVQEEGQLLVTGNQWQWNDEEIMLELPLPSDSRIANPQLRHTTQSRPDW